MVLTLCAVVSKMLKGSMEVMCTCAAGDHLILVNNTWSGDIATNNASTTEMRDVCQSEDDCE